MFVILFLILSIMAQILPLGHPRLNLSPTHVQKLIGTDFNKALNHINVNPIKRENARIQLKKETLKKLKDKLMKKMKKAPAETAPETSEGPYEAPCEEDNSWKLPTRIIIHDRDFKGNDKSYVDLIRCEDGSIAELIHGVSFDEAFEEFRVDDCGLSEGCTLNGTAIEQKLSGN